MLKKASIPDFIYEPLPENIKLSDGKLINAWTCGKDNIKGKNIGVFGPTNSGKTTVTISLLYEIKPSVVFLFSNDPNEKGDLGKYLPQKCIFNFREINDGIINKIMEIQRKKVKEHECLLKSRELNKLMTVVFEKYEEMRNEIKLLEKNTNTLIKRNMKSKAGKIQKFQIEEQIMRNAYKQILKIQTKYIIKMRKEDPKSKHFQGISDIAKSFVMETFLDPGLVIVFDDFGSALEDRDAVNYLTTINRKMDITLIFIAQCPRNLHSTIRDNLSIIIPTTFSVYMWILQYKTKNILNKKEQSSLVDLIYSSESFRYPFLDLVANIVNFIGTSVWGRFKLGSPFCEYRISGLSKDEITCENILLALSGIKL